MIPANKRTITSNPILIPNQKNIKPISIPNNPEAFLDMQKRIKSSNPILWLIKQKNRQNQPIDLDTNLLTSTLAIDESSQNTPRTSTIHKAVPPNLPLPKLNLINEYFSPNINTVNNDNKPKSPFEQNHSIVQGSGSKPRNKSTVNPKSPKSSPKTLLFTKAKIIYPKEENDNNKENENVNNNSTNLKASQNKDKSSSNSQHNSQYSSHHSHHSKHSKHSHHSHQSKHSHPSQKSNSGSSTNTLILSNDLQKINNEIYGKKIQWKKGPFIHIGENSNIFKALNMENGNIFVVKEYLGIEDPIAKRILNEGDFTYLTNKINIRILPKPFVHIPRLGQSTLAPVILRFNNHGEPDSNGRFTIKCKGECHNPYDAGKIKEMAEQILSLDLDEAKEAYERADSNKKYMGLTS